MNALSIVNLTKSVKDENLFTDVTFGLEEGEKVGIIGKNGAGKSTLLKVIDSTLPADSGSVVVNSSLRLGRLDQDVSFPPGCTLEEYLRLYNDDRIRMLVAFENGDSSLTQVLEENGVWEIEERYLRYLSELGVQCSLTQSMDTMSGGMLKKAAIARLLALEINIMLLDEPTNHLDIPAIEWLEKYLAAKNCTVILVTHDRYFLDRICNRIIEFDKHKVYFYEGGYTAFLQGREERLEAMQKEQDRLANILRRELEWIRRGPQARTGKDSGRKKRFEEMQSQVTHQQAEDRAFSSLQRRMGKKILELKNVCVSRGDKKILSSFDFEFVKGQRIGIIGPNGSGKSTLLEVLVSNLKPDSGVVDTGVNTHFGYYDQMSQNLPLEKTPLEFFSDISENIVLSDSYQVTPARFLELFGFPSSFHRLPISVLSGGEKRRLYLLSCLVSNPNFLVLDEPTNDLDIDTLRRLEQYIIDFNGCVVSVSHDRAFLDRTCDELIVMPYAERFEGNYSDWVGERNIIRKAETREKPKTAERVVKREKKGLSFREQKEFEALESTIEQIENRINEIEKVFSSGKIDVTGELTKEYNALKAELEKNYMRWNELAEKM